MIRKALWLSATSAFLTLFTLGAHAEDRVVNVFNWSDYIDSSIIDDFTKETGIKVVYDTFDSNEILETKLLAGGSGYDVVVPSGNFLARQIQAGVFQKLDKSKLPNISNMWDVVSERTAKYDPGNEYSINYMWGTVGIGYNIKKVQAALGTDKIDSWDVFFNPESLAKLKDCGVYVLEFAGRHHAGGIEISRSRPEQHLARRYRQGRGSSAEDPTLRSASSIRPNTSMPWPMAISAWRSACRATSSRRATAQTRPSRASKSATPCRRKARRCGSTRWRSRPMHRMSPRRSNSSTT